MAAQQATQGQPTATPRPMALNRLETVGTAGWYEATARADHRGNPTAIEGDQAKQQLADPFLKQDQQNKCSDPP